MELERVGERHGKEIFLACLETIEEPFDRGGLPGRIFHVLAAVDQPLDEQRFRSLARSILEAGAVFVVTAGSAATLAHDLFDEVIIEDDFRIDEHHAIRTVAFDEQEGEPLEDAASFLLNATTTDECERERRAALALAVGDSGKRERLRSALAAKVSPLA